MSCRYVLTSHGRFDEKTKYPAGKFCVRKLEVRKVSRLTPHLAAGQRPLRALSSFLQSRESAKSPLQRHLLQLFLASFSLFFRAQKGRDCDAIKISCDFMDLEDGTRCKGDELTFDNGDDIEMT